MDVSDFQKNKGKKERELVAGMDYTTEQVMDGMNGIAEAYLKNEGKTETDNEQ